MNNSKIFHQAGASQYAYLGREQIFPSLDCQKDFRAGFTKPPKIFPRKMLLIKFDLFGFIKPDILFGTNNSD